MSVLWRFPSAVTSSLAPLLSSRNSVTVSWPIKKGHDFLAWKRIPTLVLQDTKEAMEFFEKTNVYRESYNAKVKQTRVNIARIMGVDPEHYSDAEMKLSLMYLLPSDLQKKKYRPHIPEELPVKSVLQILTEYGGSTSGTEGEDMEKNHRANIRLLHNIILDALKEVENQPDLSVLIDPEELVSLSTELEESEVADPGPDMSLSTESEESDVADPDCSVVAEVCAALQAFPFVPRQCGSELVDSTLKLQFDKLNSVIEDRPDLIRMFHPHLQQLVHEQHDEQLLDRTVSHHSTSSTRDWIFRAKVNRVFLFNSVVTTMVPGTGQLTINNHSYLDFFHEIIARMIVISPLRLTGTLGVFDINIEVDQEDPEHSNGLAHCVAMSIADCLKRYDPELYRPLQVVYKNQLRVEYKKAAKRNSRSRYPWRKR